MDSKAYTEAVKNKVDTVPISTIVSGRVILSRMDIKVLPNGVIVFDNDLDVSGNPELKELPSTLRVIKGSVDVTGTKVRIPSGLAVGGYVFCDKAYIDSLSTEEAISLSKYRLYDGRSSHIQDYLNHILQGDAVCEVL